MPDTKRTATGVLGGFAGLIGLSAIAGLLVTATVTPAIALTSNAASSAINMFDKLPSYLDIDALMLPTTLYAKDSKTDKFVELTSFYDQNRSPVKYNEIAPVMYDALLSSEDPRYYQHGGVDLIGTTRAILQNLRGGGETQGGSSISQQYVKNVLVQKCEADAKTIYKTDDAGQNVLDEDGNPIIEQTADEVKQACWLEATTSVGAEGYQRKIQEMRYAIALEQRYSKNEILLGYLNIANFGGTNYGIDAAAKYYFGVPASKLTLGQAATLAGMVQNPNVYRIDRPNGSFTHSDGSVTNGAADGYADTTVRRNYVLGRMLEDGKITQEQHDAAKAEPITPKITEPRTGCAASSAPYFCAYVRSIIATDPAFGATPEDRQKALRQGGLQVYTTLDLQLQKTVDSTMEKYTVPKKTISGGKNGGRFGSAAVSIEADTGRILAIGQNTKFSEDADLVKKDKSYSSLVYAGDKQNGGSIGFPSGSTFKLFTFLDWLEKGNSINEVLNGRNRAFDRFTNSCDGDWVNTKNVKVPNSGGAGGFVGTPMRFMITSMNSGFFAMAQKLDLCDIQKVATKLGVEKADGKGPVDMTTQFSILGSNNVSPIAMAGAYAAVANKGIFCEPRAIDRVTDADGNDLPVPDKKCSQQLDPKVAATAAYALRAVMTQGTGTAGNPGGDVPVIGKTGTHNKTQKWLIESSTKVTTAVWAGNERGDGNIEANAIKGTSIVNLPFYMNRAIQKKANALYGGKKFPSPDSKLTRQVYTTLPNVIGMSVSAAKKKLRDAGFDVKVGPEVDSTEGKGIIAKQSPGAGKVAGGATVTINPSNGRGLEVPDVSGMTADQAQGALQQRFSNVQRDNNCHGNAPVIGTAPEAGTIVNPNTAITIRCQPGGAGGGPGNGGPGNGP